MSLEVWSLLFSWFCSPSLSNRGHVHRDALALLAGAAVASQPGAYVSVDDWRLELDLFSFDNQKLVFTYILFIALLRRS